MPFPSLSAAGTLTDRYLLWLKFAKRLAKYSLWSSILLLNMEHSRSSEEHNEANRTEWRKLLTIGPWRTPSETVAQAAGAQIFSGRGNSGDAFTSFIDAHQKAGRPVTLVQDMRPRSLVAKDQTFRSRHSLLTLSLEGATSILEPASANHPHVHPIPALTTSMGCRSRTLRIDGGTRLATDIMRKKKGGDERRQA
jgi:hypothetical protein